MTPASPAKKTAALQPPSAIAVVGFYALAMYLFFYLSRFFDVLGVNLKVTMILNLVFWAAALVAGGLPILVQSKAGRLMALFYGCMILSWPFSIWRGGSMEYMSTAIRSLLLMASIMALAVTTQWALRLMYVIGFAMAAAGTMSVVFGEQSERGRLALSAGTLADPNYYAMALLMGLPFVLLKAVNEPHVFKRALPLAATIPILYAAIQTGSRGGMLALVVMLTVFLVRSQMQTRVVVMITVVAGIVAAVVLFPDDLINRYRTLFAPAESEQSAMKDIEDQEVAAASANARKYLFIRSVEMTIKNPIFGVGPGMFSFAEADDAKDQGVKAAWHETHNTYTQVSSEIGIPAFLLYVSALVIALRSVYRLSKVKPVKADVRWQQVRNGAFYLYLALVTAMSGAMFLSIAYTGVLFILVGLAMALERAAYREFEFAPQHRLPFASHVTLPAPVRRRPVVGQNV
jgi:O-antigen ligase